MDAQTAPPKAAERPSAQQLKHQICTAVQQLTKSGQPQGWREWDGRKIVQFIEDVQGCHTGRSLHGLQLCAERVIEAYGRTPREILPAEAFK